MSLGAFWVGNQTCDLLGSPEDVGEGKRLCECHAATALDWQDKSSNGVVRFIADYGNGYYIVVSNRA